MFDYPGPDRVELDVGVAGEQVGFRLHQAGFEAPLPQCSAAPIGVIDVGDVASPEVLHGPADAIGVIRSQEQVDVVGHQHIRRYPA